MAAIPTKIDLLIRSQSAEQVKIARQIAQGIYYIDRPVPQEAQRRGKRLQWYLRGSSLRIQQLVHNAAAALHSTEELCVKSPV